jgi:Dipeptide/tripeptide permease
MANAAGRKVTEDMFGHPKGLWVLAGTELWDRISFHGMQAILTLYLASELLLGNHPEHVIAMGAFRHVVEAVTGPLTTNAFATQTFGIYIALVYATPILGGWIGDRLAQPQAQRQPRRGADDARPFQPGVRCLPFCSECCSWRAVPGCCAAICRRR